MSDRRSLMSMVLAVLAMAIMIGDASAGVINGRVLETDGAHLIVESITINVYSTASTSPIQTIPVTNGTFSITVAGSTLPADKRISLEFVRGATKQKINGIDGNSPRPMQLEVILQPRTFALERPHAEVSVCEPACERVRRCRCSIFAKRR